ncbi:MAG: phosphoesterase PA-phosphatase related [Labilithrix sp.]|nr:phosphoesterase PA-phosphatase related [Labilithrix sp.]
MGSVLTRLAALVIAVSVLVAPRAARADAPRPHQLKYDVVIDSSIIGASVAFMLATELSGVVKPRECRWCGRDGEVSEVNGFDRWGRSRLKWRDPQAAQFDSGVTAFLLEPAFATVDMIVVAAADNADRAFPVDLLVMSEAVAVSTVLNQFTKIIFARERPFVHALTPDERRKTVNPGDNNVSFYSGHSALSFSLAAAAGTVATMRGYRGMPVVWGTLMPLAVATGYLRIAADKHYLSDVLTGAVVGTAIGVLVPLVFHNRQGDARVQLGPGDRPPIDDVSAPLRAAPPGPMITLGGGF